MNQLGIGAFVKYKCGGDDWLGPATIAEHDVRNARFRMSNGDFVGYLTECKVVLGDMGNYGEVPVKADVPSLFNFGPKAYMRFNECFRHW